MTTEEGRHIADVDEGNCYPESTLQNSIALMPPYDHADLASVVKIAACGNDGQAWDRLVSAYEGMLTRIGRSYHLDPASTQDAMQDTWLAAFNSIGSLREVERFGSWLATVMHRICLRKRTSQREEPHDPTVLSAMLDGAGGSSPEFQVIANEEHARLANAIGKLPSHQRRLVAALLTDRSYKDIAEMLQTTVGFVGPTRARALSRLRATLATPVEQAS